MRPIKCVLFDLDGTLLPMDLDEFIKVYFGALTKALIPHGYGAEEFVSQFIKFFVSIVSKGLAVIRRTSETANPVRLRP